MLMVLAATLICGASVLVSCFSNDDNPTPSEPTAVTIKSEG